VPVLPAPLRAQDGAFYAFALAFAEKGRFRLMSGHGTSRFDSSGWTPWAAPSLRRRVRRHGPVAVGIVLRDARP